MKADLLQHLVETGGEALKDCEFNLNLKLLEHLIEDKPFFILPAGPGAALNSLFSDLHFRFSCPD